MPIEAFVAGSPAGQEIERLIQLLAKLPGLGPRSARRAALALLKKRETLLEPLADALAKAAAALKQCSNCGNLDTADPCVLCRDPAETLHAEKWAVVEFDRPTSASAVCERITEVLGQRE